MTLSKKAKAFKEFTDEDLQAELDRRFKVKRGPVIGYRAICYGDEYDYGGYSDYIIGDKFWPTKEEAKAYAERCVESSDHGGRVEEIFKDTPKPGRIH